MGIQAAGALIANGNHARTDGFVSLRALARATRVALGPPRLATPTTPVPRRPPAPRGRAGCRPERPPVVGGGAAGRGGGVPGCGPAPLPPLGEADALLQRPGSELRSRPPVCQRRARPRARGRRARRAGDSAGL